MQAEVESDTDSLVTDLKVALLIGVSTCVEATMSGPLHMQRRDRSLVLAVARYKCGPGLVEKSPTACFILF